MNKHTIIAILFLTGAAYTLYAGRPISIELHYSDPESENKNTYIATSGNTERLQGAVIQDTVRVISNKEAVDKNKTAIDVKTGTIKSLGNIKASTSDIIAALEKNTSYEPFNSSEKTALAHAIDEAIKPDGDINLLNTVLKNIGVHINEESLVKIIDNAENMKGSLINKMKVLYSKIAASKNNVTRYKTPMDNEHDFRKTFQVTSSTADKLVKMLPVVRMDADGFQENFKLQDKNSLLKEYKDAKYKPDREDIIKKACGLITMNDIKEQERKDFDMLKKQVQAEAEAKAKAEKEKQISDAKSAQIFSSFSTKGEDQLKSYQEILSNINKGDQDNAIQEYNIFQLEDLIANIQHELSKNNTDSYVSEKKDCQDLLPKLEEMLKDINNRKAELNAKAADEAREEAEKEKRDQKEASEKQAKRNALKSPSGQKRVTDAYETLKLSLDANDAEIKTAYRKLSLTHHPDKGGNDVDFRKITDAYETISLYKNWQ